uniref:Uncharacterized protein n=1 Tax=Anguilla anguilla TaxID=7936 RepID=A0A0E9XEI1_ANGAN
MGESYYSSGTVDTVLLLCWSSTCACFLTLVLVQFGAIFHSRTWYIYLRKHRYEWFS